MSRTPIVLLLALLLGGCYVGRRAENLDLARQPRGAMVRLQTGAGAVNGELLQVQDTALLVLDSQQRVSLVPYRAIRLGEAEMVREVTRGGRVPSEAHRQRLARISRFPQGLSPETQRALLAAYGQTELRVVRP
jgi:hypothetical protein